MAPPTVDPFTLEIIKESLLAISDEMFIATQRTAMSTIISEVLDFAVGLTDAQGRLITHGQGLTLFLGTLDFGVRSVIEKFGVTSLKPGDIFMTNDPYTGGGTHLSDVSLIMPIFSVGQVVAFAANKAHWTEVGGKDAGSWTTDATEIYQEGLQFPCIKLFDAGRVLDGLVDLIRANVRTPDMSVADMYAQVASLRIADRRFRELCDKNGLDIVLAGVEALLDYSEILTRQELQKIPRGVYNAVDYVEDDGFGHGPFEVRVKVTIADDEVVCDFTGSHPQLAGPVNCTRTGLYSGVRSVFIGLVRPGIPINDGALRPLRIVCPEGTLFSCQRPAPVSTYWEVMSYAADLIWKALAPVLPERLPAGHYLSTCSIVLAGPHGDSGDFVLLTGPTSGGWGAGANKDGENALGSLALGETYDVPVEVFEVRYGHLVDEYGFAVSTQGEGAGKFRGGRGVARQYRILADDTFVSGTCARAQYAPWGMHGGLAGSRNHLDFQFADDGRRLTTGKIARCAVKRGDTVRIVTATGGGYGHPHERPVEMVRDDVRNGFVTLHEAAAVYGVTIEPITLSIVSVARTLPSSVAMGQSDNTKPS